MLLTRSIGLIEPAMIVMLGLAGWFSASVLDANDELRLVTNQRRWPFGPRFASYFYTSLIVML